MKFLDTLKIEMCVLFRPDRAFAVNRNRVGGRHLCDPYRAGKHPSKWLDRFKNAGTCFPNPAPTAQVRQRVKHYRVAAGPRIYSEVQSIFVFIRNL